MRNEKMIFVLLVTVLLFSIDLMLPKVDLVSVARDRISKATGVPGDKMMFCSDRGNELRGHYKMNDGTYYGSNFGRPENGYQDYAMEKNLKLLLVKADREGDKKYVLLMNFGGHPAKIGGSTMKNISADYVGSTRFALEYDSGMLFAFYQAAGGNQNTTTRMPGETYIDDYIQSGETMSVPLVSLTGVSVK